MKELKEITLPEYEIWEDPTTEEILIKFRMFRRRGWRGAPAIKRGIVLAINRSDLLGCMEDVAEGEQYPQLNIRMAR